jgi:hypothetical protein
MDGIKGTNLSPTQFPDSSNVQLPRRSDSQQVINAPGTGLLDTFSFHVGKNIVIVNQPDSQENAPRPSSSSSSSFSSDSSTPGSVSGNPPNPPTIASSQLVKREPAPPKGGKHITIVLENGTRFEYSNSNSNPSSKCLIL